MKLSENTILITGGTSGIGLALAKKFHELNNTLILVGRDKTKLDRISQELPTIYTFQCDLADKNELAKLIEYIKNNHDPLNILVNNAAVQFNYQFITEPDYSQKIDYEVNANLISPVKLTSALLPLLSKHTESAIVNVSSGLFIAPKQSASVYCATKAAIHSFSQTLRYQLEETNIRVFEIIPALIDTPMTTGRGKGKISVEQLVAEFLRDFKADKFESYIGKTKLLRAIHRIAPRLAYRIMKNGI